MLLNPQDFEDLHKLKEPEKAELDMATKIVTDLSGEFDITEFEDTYMKRVEELIAQKVKGEKIHIEKPPEVEAKGLMVALRETLKQLETEMSRHIYKPMLAKVAPDAFTDKDWIFEIKWDGFRAIAYVDDNLSLKSRNGKELKHNFPELQELTRLAKGLVLDGEIVVMKEGKPDFQALLERGQAVSAGEIQRPSKDGRQRNTWFLTF